MNNITPLRASDLDAQMVLKNALEHAPHYQDCFVVLMNRDNDSDLVIACTALPAAQLSLIGTIGHDLALKKVTGEWEVEI